ncbi:hypothetical protein DL93DRAFT_2167268 [Clavulina sp. PMI_390]|nr:hypothetical protein DL93DRAFT_2167268 [Clavulina sp. PMI_390]
MSKSEGLVDGVTRQLIIPGGHSSGAQKSVCDSVATLGMCPHELILRLPALPYGAKTLRLSWPASFPARFFVSMLDEEALAKLNGSTNSTVYEDDGVSHRASPFVYARVLLQATGVRSPNDHQGGTQDNVDIPVSILYESLAFGAVPTSILPTIILLIMVLVTSVLLVKPVIASVDLLSASFDGESEKRKKS